MTSPLNGLVSGNVGPPGSDHWPLMKCVVRRADGSTEVISFITLS